jgi:hypothetical protein
MREMPRRLVGFVRMSQQCGRFFHLRVREGGFECVDIGIGHGDCGGSGNAVG